jgi:outer membrane receptor protein involved in Fe transport
MGRSPADTLSIEVTVLNELDQPLEAAVVSMHLSNNNSIVKIELTDAKGHARLHKFQPGQYYFVISFSGYTTDTTRSMQMSPGNVQDLNIRLHTKSTNLQEVVVQGIKPFVQFENGKVVVNPDASPSNAGTNILELLEKMPGVTIDQNGNISLKSKSNVLVMLDGKPTYLSGTDLANLLSSMSSAQVDQVELITNPPARYDASGNAGIINIKTKKNKQRGFNGNLNLSYNQGFYPKTSNSFSLNLREGKVNTYFNYNSTYNKFYVDLYALRKYYDDAGNIIAKLDQPTTFGGYFLNHTLRTGIDYFAGSKTTLGIGLTGIWTARVGNNFATATWMSPEDKVDSVLTTASTIDYKLTNGGLNLNLRHNFSSRQELAVDLDGLTYDIHNNQTFVNSYPTPGELNDSTNGQIPSTLKILTAKADYTYQLVNGPKLEFGGKGSYINTDNLALYQYNDGTGWQPDYGKTNHFLYKENIQALYSSLDYQWSHFTLQAGLRYENTYYDANQLGNPTRKDSSFSRHYDGFFPSGTLTWQADSSNSFTITIGRRIDRPAFQRLNPFVFIVNKYTYETGNPYFRPQYSWNIELSHQFKNVLTTTLSYSMIRDYFSQLFLTDTNGILYYSQGNVGNAYIAGLSMSTNLKPFKWWTLSGQAMLNYKKLDGYVWANYESSIWQFNVSANNQFMIGKIYTAELSGYFTGPSRNDLQEELLPTGQLNIGLARPVMKNNGTVKISVRDLLHTQTMSGNTTFQHATEYFMIRRDSRVLTVAFTYRFGKQLKTIQRNNGAEDEIQRVNG